MEVQFTTAECGFCSRLQTREGHEDHISQLHLPISSLPSPGEPLEISHFPIIITSGTDNFRPQKIANLWLQLLVIQVQNANFWNYDDVLKVEAEKAYQRSLAAWKASYPEQSETNKLHQDKSLDLKSCLFLRHKLQVACLSRDTPVTESIMPDVSGFIRKLEEEPDIEAKILLKTKLHKVLKAILKLGTMPADEEFKIRDRCQLLLDRWETTLEDYVPGHSDDNKPTSGPSPPSYADELERLMQWDTAQNASEMQSTPAVCITQMTPDECSKVEVMARLCDPPLDRAVVELMCLLPQFSAQNEHEMYYISPFGQPSTHKGIPERTLAPFGLKLPPHILSLASVPAAHGSGRALYVDTKTGDGLILKADEWNGDQYPPKWEDILREVKPIEEILQGWIDRYLTGKFMPSGGSEFVHEEAPRYLTYWLMDAIKHNTLLQEFGWPQSFPLSGSRYLDFLKRKRDLHAVTFRNHPRSLAYKWADLVHEWYSCNESCLELDSSNVQHVQGYKLLAATDRRIRTALDHYERQIGDYEYALVADVPMQPRYYFGNMSWQRSTASVDDYDISSDMIQERFEQVCATPHTPKDDSTPKMREVMVKFIEELKLDYPYLIREAKWIEAVDDDSSSDYEPTDEETDRSEDEEECEYSEDGDDLDGAALQADMVDDMDLVRLGIQGYQTDCVGISFCSLCDKK